MIFGDAVQRPGAAVAADWLHRECRGAFGTVGWLVPDRFPSLIRLRAPEPSHDWWREYRDLVACIVTVGERHTSTPEHGWFGIWDGHGWANTRTHLGVRGPLSDDEQRVLDQRRAELREEDRRRTADITVGLSDIPTFVRPDRAYYMVSGPLSAAVELREPGTPERWQHPDLFWPDDRDWFAATDVDVWSYYVGGDADLVADLREHCPTPTEPVTPDQFLETEE